MKKSTNLTGQRGFLSFCLLLNIAALAFLGYIGIKLVGPYMEFHVFSNAVEEVSRLDDFKRLSARKIKGRMGESVRRNSGVNPTELKVNDVAYIVLRDGQKVLGVEYEVVVYMFYNVSVLLDFKFESTDVK